MIKAGIIGGAGYTAGELIRLLINHPDVDIKFINSSSNAGNKITFYKNVDNTIHKNENRVIHVISMRLFLFQTSLHCFNDR
jgi:N-acetyl-gamma-glutamylphosphate reductase